VEAAVVVMEVAAAVAVELVEAEAPATRPPVHFAF
jgi:hypothetical protein